jgi:hypothetical protein
MSDVLGPERGSHEQAASVTSNAKDTNEARVMRKALIPDKV